MAHQFLVIIYCVFKVYRFLQAEVKAYLSTYESMTIYHLRDMAAGQRRILKAKDIKVIQVPHYEGLAIKHMLEFAG